MIHHDPGNPEHQPDPFMALLPYDWPVRRLHSEGILPVLAMSAHPDDLETGYYAGDTLIPKELCEVVDFDT
jgi:hypothetical protein